MTIDKILDIILAVLTLGISILHRNKRKAIAAKDAEIAALKQKNLRDAELKKVAEEKLKNLMKGTK